MLHSLMLFAHVTSAMIIVAAFGIEGLVLLQLRHASGVDQARGVLQSFRYAQRTGGAGVGLTVVTGIYLASVYWGWRGAWMGTAFLTVVAIAVIGATTTGRSVAALLGASAEPGRAALLEQRRGVLVASFALRTALLAGIVFLMTVKPATWQVSVSTVVAAGAIGLLLGLPGLRQAPRPGTASRTS